MSDEIAKTEPIELAHGRVEQVIVTDDHRAALYALITEDPWRGHIKAARMAGIKGSKGQISEFLDADEGFQEFLEDARGVLLDNADLSVPHLFKKLASVVNNDGHSSQLRAITDALAFRGIGARQTVQVEHSGQVVIEKREVSLTGVLHVLAEAGALPDELAGPLRHLAAARDVLPAQPD